MEASYPSCHWIQPNQQWCQLEEILFLILEIKQMYIVREYILMGTHGHFFPNESIKFFQSSEPNRERGSMDNAVPLKSN